MRLIDADALIKKLSLIGSKLPYEDRAVFLTVSLLIGNPSECPTVDAVQVVRCGECINWWSEERQCKDEMGFARHWNADDYCSNGKRREE